MRNFFKPAAKCATALVGGAATAGLTFLARNYVEPSMLKDVAEIGSVALGSVATAYGASRISSGSRSSLVATTLGFTAFAGVICGVMRQENPSPNQPTPITTTMSWPNLPGAH